MAQPPPPTPEDIQQAATDLEDAALILHTWARELGQDNLDGHRGEDIRFLMERARRYRASAAALRGSSPEASSARDVHGT